MVIRDLNTTTHEVFCVLSMSNVASWEMLTLGSRVQAIKSEGRRAGEVVVRCRKYKSIAWGGGGDDDDANGGNGEVVVRYRK